MSARRIRFADKFAQAATSPPLERVDRTRGPLREQIYGMIRRMILTGEFAPGLVIDEKAIALKLGVSRTPVREAVKKLSDENLVEVKAQSATAIASIDRKLIHEAFLIRRALEVESIGIAATRMSKQHEERLEELHLLHARAIQRERYIDAIARDDAFHSYISEISDLPRLWQAVEISKAQLDRCRFLTVPRPGQAEATLVRHRDILGALIKKDEALSRLMMSEHLEKSYDGIVAFLETTEVEPIAAPAF
jgi:GntR family transcriptional regulator, rspAB operon transcriptional repressor